MIFAKNQEVEFFCAKVQSHPGSSEIGRSLRKFQNAPTKAATTKRELI
jgi:hypothetical protein